MDYTVHTPHQLAQALRSQRKSKHLTQKTAGAAVGLLPKTISGLESSPQRCTLASLFKLLSALELELVLRPKLSETDASIDSQW